MEHTKSMREDAAPQTAALTAQNLSKLGTQAKGSWHSPSESGATSLAFMEGNRNFCHKHKKRFVNYCLDHGVPLCAMCFDDHKNHKIEMLENYAQAEINKLQSVVEHLENQLKHVRDKTALRTSLMEKKQVAAKQFFELMHSELNRLEEEFWEKFTVERKEEEDLMRQMEEFQGQMEDQYQEILPLYDSMEEKINNSEFYDVLERKALIWKINEEFKKNNSQFYQVIKDTVDSELIFDRFECKKDFAAFIDTHLVVKKHLLEIMELKEKAIITYQPFDSPYPRKINLDDPNLTQNPTILNSRELGRLILLGGNVDYHSSRKVFIVDECMNTLQLHSKLNMGRVGHAAMLLRNKDLFVIGGYNSQKNLWLKTTEICFDAFEEHKSEWQYMAEMHEPRYYFAACTWNEDYIFVFGGKNDSFMESHVKENYSKCLNTIERYNLEVNRWDQIELKTYEKLPFCSHLVAVHIKLDKDRILIIGGESYNKKSDKFEAVQTVFKFDPIDEKVKKCQGLKFADRFVMGQSICDGQLGVCALGEKYLHSYNGKEWQLIEKGQQPQLP